MRLGILAVVMLALGLLIRCSPPIHAQQHTVTLKGKLFSDGTECSFFLDPEGDSESVGLTAGNGAYLCDWLKGVANRASLTIALTPE